MLLKFYKKVEWMEKSKIIYILNTIALKTKTIKYMTNLTHLKSVAYKRCFYRIMSVIINGSEQTQENDDITNHSFQKEKMM